MRYMVIETFKHGLAPVYARLRDTGRMVPEGLTYIDSWIADDMRTCYQLMETDDPALFDLWTSAWSDLTDFTIIPVISSAEAQARHA